MIFAESYLLIEFAAPQSLGSGEAAIFDWKTAVTATAAMGSSIGLTTHTIGVPFRPRICH